MILDELFERAIVLTKLVWRKHGDEISRHQVQRMVAIDVQPHAYSKAEDADG
jgi:hypothetical protein